MTLPVSPHIISMLTSSEEEQNSALSAQAELSIDRNIAAQSCAADVSNADDTNHVARLEKIMTSDLSEKNDTDDAVRFDMAMTSDTSAEALADAQAIGQSETQQPQENEVSKEDRRQFVRQKTTEYIKRTAVREGTVAAALLVGIIAKTLNRFIVPLGKKFFLPRQKQSDKTQDNNKNEDKKEA